MNWKTGLFGGANLASVASMRCAGTRICDNVVAQKEGSRIQGKDSP